ncbi:Uncharacterized protein PBTT_01809 [Plasmodiophora brassicae]|uniref:Uncharacterized protein n=1 Tax=Plasmodiophora brassicae TaxID=37360 RepID=A0A3P3Y2Y0_PLABS|nr:unnamed protein product [Plasmodiophora brassicae]
MFLMSPTRHLLGYRIGEINTVHIAATRCTWYDLVRSQESPADLGNKADAILAECDEQESQAITLVQLGKVAADHPNHVFPVYHMMATLNSGGRSPQQ